MAKKRKKKRESGGKRQQKARSKSNGNRSSGERAEAESTPNERRAEAATVAWMLAAISTLFGSVVGAALFAIVQEAQPEARLLPQVMFFAARMSSIIALVMTPIVYWLRDDAPPKLITCGVLAIVAAPWLLSMWLTP